MNSYIISFVCVFFTALTGSYFTNKAVNTPWYNCIKPKITPPKLVFPIAWTIIYILLALSFQKAIKKKDKKLIILYSFNLILNALWCYLYFNKYIISSVIVILLLLQTNIFILMNIDDTFSRISMSIYTLWVMFATLLNLLSIKNINNC
jgi:tryptophan-rich sensory protein